MGPSHLDIDNATAALAAALDEVRCVGIRSPKLDIPAVLADVLRLPETASPREARQLLHKSLLSTAAFLPQDLKDVFFIAAGFRQGVPDSPGSRVDAAAELLKISRRTAYRRLNAATVQLATVLCDARAVPHVEGVDFVFTRSHCRVDMRRKQPVVFLERTILAYRDNITYIDEQFQLARLVGPYKPLYHSVEGCTRPHLSKASDAIWTARLQFKEPLRTGMEHSFATSLTLPSLDALEPVIGFVPHTASFEACVELHFGETLPEYVDHFSGTPPTSGPPLPAATRRELRVEPVMRFTFPAMKPGLGYGVRWQWPETVPLL